MTDQVAQTEQVQQTKEMSIKVGMKIIVEIEGIHLEFTRDEAEKLIQLLEEQLPS